MAELKSLCERVKIIAFAISEDYRYAASENYASRKLFFHSYHIEHKIREKPSIIYDDKRRIVVYNASAWKRAENPEIRALLQYIDGHKPENSTRVAEMQPIIDQKDAENAALKAQIAELEAQLAKAKQLA